MSENICFGGDGRWARATKYSVVDGFITPSGRYEIYDPWAMYDRWRRGVQDVEPPYLNLLNVLNILIFNPGKFNDIYISLISRTPRSLEIFEKSEMAEAILSCCQEVGPLGILPRHLQGFRNDNDGGKTYRWTPSGWCADSNDRGEDLRQVENGVWIKGELPGHWDDYFDESSVESVGYVPPLSPPFWMAYREPVVDFVLEAANLLKIFQALFDPFSEAEQVVEATKNLNAFLVSSKPLIAINEEGDMSCRWVTPSLLDAYAVMIALDTLVEPRRVILCGNCGTLFIPGDKRANFCSPKCQNTGNKKLTRRRQSMAKKLATEGLSPEEIAKKVKSDVEAVKRWIGAKEKS